MDKGMYWFYTILFAVCLVVSIFMIEGSRRDYIRALKELKKMEDKCALLGKKYTCIGILHGSHCECR